MRRTGTRKVQGYRGFVCGLCHAFYADPAADPLDGVPFPAKLEGSEGGMCPAKLHMMLKKELF